LFCGTPFHKKVGNHMGDYILEVKDVSKSFPGVKALNQVSFRVKKGEVHALVGENGAGKSTLMKILNGVYSKDTGSIFIDGKEAVINNPLDARSCGISIVFQEFNLVPILSIAENIYMGRLPRKKGMIDYQKLKEDTQRVLNMVGSDLDPFTLVETLGIAQKQMVEIAKMLSYEETRLILLDEPTATLTNKECEVLFQVVADLKKQGVTVIYISHKLEEIFAICDSITIIRDGEVIETKEVSETDRNEIITAMVGREITEVYPKREGDCSENEEILRIENFSSQGLFEDVSFSLKKGEVLGLAGLVGAGRTEIARAIFGIDYKDSGEIYLKGQKIEINSPAEAIKHGICYLSEDRKLEGLMGTLPVDWNITAANLKKACKSGMLSGKLEQQISQEMVEKLRIKTPNLKQTVFNLSGGNMQKIVIGKWLNTEIDVFIFDEPTRGIDVGAKYEIYLLINELVKEGKSVIMISSELPEIMGMSDRILVIKNGTIAGDFNVSDMTARDFIENAI
jgi:ribose transport system ATP-binding protein